MGLLEVCCADIDSVIAAKNGGADRIELCSGLECGGLTPSTGLIREAVRIMPGKVNVLIRPRPGDFLYSGRELSVIETDIRFAVESGASGIVFGALTASGSLDTRVMERMISLAFPASFTLHRAFDVVRDQIETLEMAIFLGVDRILTSGGAKDALSGVDTLRELKKRAQGRTIILAGAGVTPSNAAEIMMKSGVSELHASCKTSVPSEMAFHRPDINMGFSDTEGDFRLSASETIIKELVSIIHKK